MKDIKKWKSRALAVLMGAVVTANAISAPTVFADGEPIEPILHLSFDDFTAADTSFVSGDAYVEVRKDGDGTGVTLVEGKTGNALGLDAANSKGYLQIKKNDDTKSSFLTGYDELTIGYWSKIPSDFGFPNYWAAFFNSENGTVTWENETYVGIMDRDSVTVERYYHGRDGNPSVGGAASINVWKYVTVVIRPQSTVLYINGEKAGNQDSSHSLSKILGDNSNFYIGKADWGDGEYFKGLIDEFTIYSRAFTNNQVRQLYEGREITEDMGIETETMQRYYDTLSLSGAIPDGAVLSEGKLALPATVGDASVTWSSDHESVIAADGTVVMPGVETEVKLTAMISINGENAPKNFTIRVIPESGQVAYFSESFLIPSVLGGGMKLKSAFGARTVTWAGSDAVSADGTVTGGSMDQTVTLTAALGGTDATKTLQVTVLKNDSISLAAYTRIPLNTDTYSGKLAYSMHLAYSTDGQTYSQLNSNSGILYAKATLSARDKVQFKNLKNPYIFYLKDGGYGVAAIRTNSADESMCNMDDSESKGKVLLFTTNDFIKYEEKGLIDLKQDAYVSDVACDYDSSTGKYVLRWADIDGNYYRNTMDDVTDLDNASAPAKGSLFSYDQREVTAQGALERNYIYVPAAIGNRVITKLTKIHNTGVDVPASVTAVSQEELKEKAKVTLLYNDGSTAPKSVNWNLNGVDFEKPGTYDIMGEIKPLPAMKVDENPLGVDRADPNIFYKDGYYYFIATNDADGNQTFSIRKSNTIEGLQGAEEIQILSTSAYDDVNGMLWAPEIHEINGEIYIFFSANPGGGWNVQSFVMKLKTGKDMTKAEDWEHPILFKGKNGDALTNYGIGGITLDMTTFEVKGQNYVSWAQREFGKETGSWIYIAAIDGDEPWRLTSDPIVLTIPDYGWDNNANTPVDEGPYAIITDDKVFITFSGSAVGATYCVGLLEIDKDADLLVSENWTKWNYPIVDNNSVEGECGPGHNSYTTDEDGNLVFVYHARPVDSQGNVGARTTGLRTAHFDAEGYPVLYMTGDLELNPEYKNVSTKLVVPDKTQEAIDKVIALIDAIGDVQYNDASRKAIEAARKAYDALNEEQKKQVSNAAKLTAAEQTYKQLEKDAEKINISKVSINTIVDQNYTGKAVTPAITITYAGKTLTKDKDYMVAYSDNVKIGTASVTITGKGSYVGSLKRTFRITVFKNKTYKAGNYKYKVTNADLSGKGTVTVSGVKSRTLRSIKVADTVTIGGKKFKITAIGNSAFKNCKKAATTTIGKNVKTIGKKAFYKAVKLKTVTIKSKVLNNIGENAFKGIKNTAKIRVPKTKLGKYKNMLKGKGQKSSVIITK